MDEDGGTTGTEDPFVNLEEFVATGRIDGTTITGTQPDGTIVVEAGAELL